MSHCVECRKARYASKSKDYNRRGYLKNRTERLAKQKQDRAVNRERYSENQKRWYQRNREKVCAKVKAYASANRDKIQEYLLATREARLAKKRARRAANPGSGAEYAKAYRARNRDGFLEYMRRYNKAHRDRLLVLKKAWREANADTLSEKWAAWYEANNEQVRAMARERAKANPHKGLAIAARRRLRIAAATIQDFSLHELRQRIAVFGGRCAYCGGPHEHIDHVKPLARGGPHCLSNLRPSCAKCNLKKNAKPALKWLARLPRAAPLPLP